MNEELKKLLAEIIEKHKADAKFMYRAKFVAKVKAVGEYQVEAIIATNSIDRHGEILEIDGVDLKQYKLNPVVLWAHDYSSLPVAKTVSIKKNQDGQIVAKMEFNQDDEFAMKVYNAIKNGFLSAFSIGFIPTDGMWDDKINGYRWTKSEMLEYSVVPVPANAEALVQAKALMELGIVKAIEGEKDQDEDGEGEEGDDDVTPATHEEVAELKSMIGNLTDILSKASSATGNLVAQATEQGSGRSPRKQKILLVKAKKTAQIVDKTAELLIAQLNNQIRS